MMKMNSQEEFLPKWFPTEQRTRNASSEIGLWISLSLLVVMTLGLILCFDYIDGSTKAKGEK